MRFSYFLLAVASLAVSWVPSFAGAKADPEPFFERLESVGLETGTIRKLAAKVAIYYREPNDTKEAQYSFILKRLYIPTEMKQAASSRIRYDLPSYNINTVIHEFTHAYDMLMASKKSPKGSDEQLHYDARQAIWADIYNNPDEHFLGLARYPAMKSIEVTGYFMGDSIGAIFEAADTAVLYNEKFTKKYILAPGDAARLGDKLVLPPKDTPDRFLSTISNTKFGTGNMSASAYFEGKVVHWPENRGWTKEQIYQHALGLHPPKDVWALVDKLNELDNAWMRDVRKRVRAARAAAEKALPAVKPSDEPGDDDLRNR